MNRNTRSLPRLGHLTIVLLLLVALSTAVHTFTIGSGLGGSTVPFRVTLSSLAAGDTTLQLLLVDTTSVRVFLTKSIRNCRVETPNPAVSIVSVNAAFDSEEIVVRASSPVVKSVILSCQVTLFP